jgi:hypothetical protein
MNPSFSATHFRVFIFYKEHSLPHVSLLFPSSFAHKGGAQVIATEFLFMPLLKQCMTLDQSALRLHIGSGA